MANETVGHLVSTSAWLERSVSRGLSAGGVCRAGGAQGRGTYHVAYKTVSHLVRSVRRGLSAGDFIRSLAGLAARKAEVLIKWLTKR